VHPHHAFVYLIASEIKQMEGTAVAMLKEAH
jgi:hypothetical protein